MKPNIFIKKLFCLLMSLLLAVSMAGCFGAAPQSPSQPVVAATELPPEQPMSVAPTDTPEPTAASPPEETAAPVSTEAPSLIETPSPTEAPTPDAKKELLPEDGAYTTAEDVALYIHQYDKLPQNFITKKEAKKLGWSGGGLDKFAPGKSIGGDKFGNYEGNLPTKDGRTYTECDIDTMGAKSRGAKRIVFSNDGLIYYTDDHYSTFTLLYGEE